jgi:hypothetical protein
LHQLLHSLLHLNRLDLWHLSLLLVPLDLLHLLLQVGKDRIPWILWFLGVG